MRTKLWLRMSLGGGDWKSLEEMRLPLSYELQGREGDSCLLVTFPFFVCLATCYYFFSLSLRFPILLNFL